MVKYKTHTREELEQFEQEYEHLKQRILALGHVVQGSLTERMMVCGKPECRCHADPEYRHGPYIQFSWKEDGKTISVYLTEEQAELCRKWIANNHELEEIIHQMRNISRNIVRFK